MPLKQSLKAWGIFIVLVISWLIAAVSMSLAQGDTWVTKSNMPTPRLVCSACEVNGIIYVIGGTSETDFNTLTGLSTVEAYDPIADTWTKKSDMPTPRIDFSTCVLN